MRDHFGHQDIRLGLCVPFDRADQARWLASLGFESFALLQKGSLEAYDWQDEVRFVRDHAPVSSIGLYANPIVDIRARAELEDLIRGCHALGVSVVGCFTGALPDRSLEENLNEFQAVWTELANVAEGEGVRIGFENCPQGGDWRRPTRNLAFSPRAWQMLFDAVPSPALGLQWEPAHQTCAMAEPLRQVTAWASRIWHIHGKDARVQHDLLADLGLHSGLHSVVHRLPGFGETSWSELIARLRSAGWQGSIDIEGGHDRSFSGDLEPTGWVAALRHLRECRGGQFVPPYDH